MFDYFNGHRERGCLLSLLHIGLVLYAIVGIAIHGNIWWLWLILAGEVHDILAYAIYRRLTKKKYNRKDSFWSSKNASDALKNDKPVDETQFPKHHHSPSKLKNPLLRIFDFIYAGREIYLNHNDTGYCAVCKRKIHAPSCYYSAWLKVLFFAVGFALFWLNLNFVLCLVLLPLIYRLVTSIILTFCTWEGCDNDFDSENAWELASKERKTRLWCLYGGFLLIFAIAAVLTVIHFFLHFRW